MSFDDLPAGAAVFLDANTLIFHFANHPQHGSGSVVPHAVAMILTPFAIGAR